MLWAEFFLETLSPGVYVHVALTRYIYLHIVAGEVRPVMITVFLNSSGLFQQSVFRKGLMNMRSMDFLPCNLQDLEGSLLHLHQMTLSPSEILWSQNCFGQKDLHETGGFNVMTDCCTFDLSI